MDWFPDPMKPLSEKSAAELATEAWLYDEMTGGDDEQGSGGGPSKPPSVPPLRMLLGRYGRGAGDHDPAVVRVADEQLYFEREASHRKYLFVLLHDHDDNDCQHHLHDVLPLYDPLPVHDAGRHYTG